MNLSVTLNSVPAICVARVQADEGATGFHLAFMPPKIKDVEIHFWSKVAIKSKHECWEWQAGKNRQRVAGKMQKTYGNFMPVVINGKIEYRAHRIAFLLSGGKLSKKKPFVLHKCDNQACCNPDHLKAGDQTDNMRDRKKAGRGNHPTGDRNGLRKHPESVARGERNAASKLTEDQVREIRRIFESEKISKSELGRMFGVSNPLIGYIIRRQSWAHVA